MKLKFTSGEIQAYKNGFRSKFKERNNKGICNNFSTGDFLSLEEPKLYTEGLSYLEHWPGDSRFCQEINGFSHHSPQAEALP